MRIVPHDPRTRRFARAGSLERWRATYAESDTRCSNKAGLTTEGYVPVQVTTRSGEVIKGVAKNEDAFSIDVLDASGKLHLLTKNEIHNVTHEPRSTSAP